MFIPHSHHNESTWLPFIHKYCPCRLQIEVMVPTRPRGIITQWLQIKYVCMWYRHTRRLIKIFFSFSIDNSINIAALVCSKLCTRLHSGCYSSYATSPSMPCHAGCHSYDFIHPPTEFRLLFWHTNTPNVFTWLQDFNEGHLSLILHRL